MRRLALSLALLLLAAPPLPTRADDEAAGGVLVTEDYKSVDVRQVIADIARKAKANVIVSPDVHGTISVRFQEVPWRVALEQLVRMSGFLLVEESHGILRITALAAGRGVELGTDLYRFRHGTPDAGSSAHGDRAEPPLVEALRRVVAREHGDIRYVPSQHSVVYTGTPDTLAAVRALLEAFDRPPEVGTTTEIRRYEQLLAEARTETAALYFSGRLADLRGE